MNNPDLTLDELAARTGVEPRTLRSWVSEGLLAPPLRAGRGARYPASNADRALAVCALKNLHALSLAEIGRRFLTATDEQIRQWALEPGAMATPPGTARDYLRRIKAEAAPPPAPAAAAASYPHSMGVMSVPPPPRRPEAGATSLPPPPHRHMDEGRIDEDRMDEDSAGLERILLLLEQATDAPPPRKARGTSWARIPITADLELHVRGGLAPSEQLLFEHLADLVRAILTRRA